MEEREFVKSKKVQKLSESRLKAIIAESVCRTLRFDLLNYESNISEHPEKKNSSIRMYDSFSYVKQYAFLNAEEIGDVIRASINDIKFDELKKAYLDANNYELLKKLNGLVTKKVNGNPVTNDCLSVMLEYSAHLQNNEEAERE